MSVHGFCHQCRADVPADPRYKRPCCEACGHPLIPPTWGRRTQQWVDGGWTPDLPRPDGYVWKDPAIAASATPKRATSEVRACLGCAAEFEAAARTTRSYCSDDCRNRARLKRKKERAA